MMSKKSITLLAAVVTIIAVGVALSAIFGFSPPNEPVTILETTVPPVPTLNPDSVSMGQGLYDKYCANCHGVNLEGVSDWKITQSDGSLLPPPHNSSGHTWHHPDPVLIEIIANGGDPTLLNTKMPGFGDRLTETEINTILDYIKSYWEEEEREYQWWITARGQ
jgi:mono/diheme cytochrome c family protein